MTSGNFVVHNFEIVTKLVSPVDRNPNSSFIPLVQLNLDCEDCWGARRNLVFEFTQEEARQFLDQLQSQQIQIPSSSPSSPFDD